jgi:DNA (cytosine-5)-methyltransferase 1
LRKFGAVGKSKMTHGSLFSGIGGFDLAAEWMGWENKFHCEWNEFCKKILKHYWPDATSYGDIDETDFTIWRGLIDVLSGGFPCQPYSTAGKRKGKEDDRHKWPQMLRAIREIQPRWIVGENVPGLINWKRGMVLDEIKADLEAAGFEVMPPLILPAGGVGGRHRRERLFLVAHSNRERYQGVKPKLSNEVQPMEVAIETLAAHKFSNGIKNELPEPYVISTNNGIPVDLDGIAFSKWKEQSISGFGNAVVPQLVYEIFKAIENYENIEETQTGINP